ncbi:MAG: hypothetical protein M1837_003245 [Sclerophora amabilis]|nr:MAG: hypothetical protein M1837_003245 [Sclerophora amabilis]
MSFGGAFLRTLQTLLRVVELLASLLILGVFSYFLAVLRSNDLVIANWVKAVEGMSGAAVLYTAFAVLLTFFLGGIRFFAFLAIVLDLCFVACFAAIAVLTRNGSNSCTGIVSTPLGKGDVSTGESTENGFGFGSNGTGDYEPNLSRACKLTQACFAVAIVNIILFLITAVLQFLVAKHHQKEKRYGPSPANNYTTGSRRRFGFGKKKQHNTRDAELATTGTGHNIRPSHDTGYTGSTMAQPDKPLYNNNNNNAGHYHTAHGAQPTTYGNF